MHYEEKSNLDYKVYLKENQFYDTPYLPKDKKYISALINYIDSSFSYTFKRVSSGILYIPERT